MSDHIFGWHMCVSFVFYFICFISSKYKIFWKQGVLKLASAICASVYRLQFKIFLFVSPHISYHMCILFLMQYSLSCFSVVLISAVSRLTLHYLQVLHTGTGNLQKFVIYIDLIFSCVVITYFCLDSQFVTGLQHKVCASLYTLSI